MADGWGALNKKCPECGKQPAKFGLMMRQCDDCICNSPPPKPTYVERNGLLVPNPD